MLRKPGELARFDILDRSIINFARCHESKPDRFAKPLRNFLITVVVVRTLDHARSVSQENRPAPIEVERNLE